MKEETIKELTERVQQASTDFEKTNTELKRKYLLWNIQVFNIIASSVQVNRGSFGTGYPFYALDENLQGTLPIIQEQIRYNRQLVKDGEPVQKSIWICKQCLKDNYHDMPDLKRVCKPCPNMIDQLKPRKIINRLPDIDMWMICEDGTIEQAQVDLAQLLEKYSINTSDVDPLSSVEDVAKIADMLKSGMFPKIFLPVDSHIIEYSKIKSLIERVPVELAKAKKEERIPYLPIRPKSYRKEWQYDDEAYNFVYDYLSAFTSFNFPKELQQVLDESRMKVVSEYSSEELFGFLLNSATKSNFRRFQSVDLEQYFLDKVQSWEKLKEKQQKTLDNKNGGRDL